MSKTARHLGIEKTLNRGAELHRKGLRKEAAATYSKVLGAEPTHVGAMRLMAVLAHETGQNEKAAEWLRRAVEIEPNFTLAHRNLAHILSLLGENEGAVHHYAEASRLDPSDVNAMIEEARITSDILKDFERALSIYDRALLVAPNDARLHRGRGKMLAELQRPDEAIEAMAEAVRLAPEDANVFFHQATILAKFEKKSEAAQAFQRASEISPNDAEIWLAYANVMKDLGQAQLAVDMLTRAIELDPKSAAGYSNLGNILADEAMLGEAIAAHQTALHLNPNVPEIYNNLGSALQNACRPAEGVDVYVRALELNSDKNNNDGTYWNLALCLLSIGRLEDGWDLYGYGFASGQRSPFRPFPGLLWQGEKLTDKTIMLWREQGIGDDLRFSTCIDDIVAEAGHVIIETDYRLVPLYQRTWPEATVRIESGRATGLKNFAESDVDFDYTAPIGIAASMRRRHLADFPQTSRRPLVADAGRRQVMRTWLESLGPGPKIGLTWRSGLRTPIRDIFSTRIADWAPLLDLAGVKLINLQFGNPEEELREAEETFGVTVHRMPGLDTHNDLDGVAALTAELDGVTGLWNAATEMAGALAVSGSIYMPANHPMQLGTGTLPWHPSLHVHPVMPGFDRKVMIEAAIGDIQTALRDAGKL